MRRTSLLAVPVAFLLALIPGTASAYPNPGTVTGATTIHDPTMIRTSAGRYLLYGTGGGLGYRTSTDRIAFTAGSDAFTTKPGWWSSYATEAWAPDISYQGGKYLMYYAVSTFGSNKSAIGLATSSTGLAAPGPTRGPSTPPRPPATTTPSTRTCSSTATASGGCPSAVGGRA